MTTQSFTFADLFRPLTRRLTAAVTVFLFVFSFYSPGVKAAYDVINEGQRAPRNQLSTYSPLGHNLQQLQTLVAGLRPLTQQPRLTDAERATLEKTMARIARLHPQLEEQDQRMRAALADQLARMEQKSLPDHIQARQQRFNANYIDHMDRILAITDQLSAIADRAILDAKALNDLLIPLAQTLDYPLGTPQQSFSSDLDFIDAPPRPIYTSLSQIRALLGTDGTERPLDDYLLTDDATAGTERIETLVNNLGTDPITLYNWVHDNLRYIPSYGLMQGADYSLQSEQGNAFDIASTLIALYREAGIPARYRYGTVALPAEQVQNWVGGVANVDAATNLLSQGGIPQQQIGYGGAIEEVELEHVWVEAQINGQWVALDPSFKQYNYTDGMDIQAAVPLDINSLITDLDASATKNEAEGWVQGLDANLVRNALTDYQNDLETYFTNQASNATLGDVLGQQKVIPSEVSSLDNLDLPYSRIIASEQVPNLPSSLYHRFKLQIGDTTGGSFGMPVQWNSILAELDQRTVNLTGKALAISFKPATVADEQTLLSYIPDTIESIEDLPNQLPANSIYMIGEITLDGDVIASTSEVTLGQALMTRLGYIAPQRAWSYSENHLIAGSYQAVGIDMQGISSDQLNSLRDRLENTKAILSNENETQINSLTKHDMVMDILHMGIQSYLAETFAMDKLVAKKANVVHYRSPSYGTFSTAIEVSYLFGSPSQVNFAGVVMDVDRVSANSESKTNCYEDWVAFNRSSGMRSSAYEHLIPERLLSTEGNPVKGVSTAKALSLAVAQGQRIYTLTQSNADQLQNITIDDAARSEIQQALNLGLEVMVHQNPINVNGWEGSGYSIIDSEYGIGAYKISGGTSGGFISDDWTGALTFIALVLGIIGAAFSTPIVAFIASILSLALAYDGYLKLEDEIIGTNCENSGVLELYAGLVIGTAVLGFLFGGLAALAILSWVGFIVAGAISGAFLRDGGVCD